MRRHGPTIVLGVWLMTTGLPAAQQTTAAAETLLTKARAALGGDWTFASFKVTGTIKSRNPGESGRFEITCELPRKFVQFETRTFLRPYTGVDDWGAGAGASIDHRTVTLGFDGEEVIYGSHPYNPRYHYPPSPLPKDQYPVVLPKARVAFVNLTMGLFASSFQSAPVRFTDAAGPGAHRAVVVSGADFTRTLVVGSSRVDLQACKLEYSIVSPK